MGWGEALGSASNSFVDTYTKFQQNDRANEEQERLKAAQAIQAQLQQEKIKEIERKGLMGQAIQSKVEEINKPFMAEYLDPTTGKAEKGEYKNMQTFWEHQGQDPNEEFMKVILPVVAQHDPELATKIASQLIKSKTMRDVAGKRGVAQQDSIPKPPSGFKYQGTDVPPLEPIQGGPQDETNKPKKMSYADQVLVKQKYSELGGYQKKALESAPKIQQLNSMIDAVENGNVGGLEGGAKAMLAPFAAAIGLDPNGTFADAQAFKLKARAYVAGMRLQLIGPGPMSDPEQKLLDRLSGGNTLVARRAAAELFTLYRDLVSSDIKTYRLMYNLHKKKDKNIEEAFLSPDDLLGGGSNTEAKPSEPTGQRDISTAVNFVQGAKTREEAKKRWTQLLDPSKKWSKEELKKISDSLDDSRWK
jgi:hypothetical protein